MSAHLCDRRLNVLSIVGPVGNNALQAVGVAAEVRHHVERPVVVCSVGDGTTQQGEFLEAVAEAVREKLPVLFLIEDNRWSISTRTPGRTCCSLPDGPAAEFYGIPIDRLDGRDPLAAMEGFGEVVRRLRDQRRPAIVWLEVERLCDHTNADDQTLYRDAGEIEAGRSRADPLRMLADRLPALGVDAATLRGIDAEVAREVALAAEQALDGLEPRAVFTAKAPLGERLSWGDLPRSSTSDDVGRSPHAVASPTPARSTMCEALRATLRHHLHTDDRVILLGEDIEDPKGDVFGVTRGLSSEFAGRVRNSPLAEATILGVSIGRALAGARPVAFLQFADFLPLAYNQIHCELGSLYWRTDGAWQAPVIVMIACGGYRPGLGPFHAQTFEAIAAHTPGIDVVMPSTAADAAGLLDAAFASGRPTLFFYPKARLNIAEDPASAEVSDQFVPLGKARVVRRGDALTFVSWGNTLAHCVQTADALATIGLEADVIDLRSLSPWDETAVLASAERTRRLVVVHEDNHTCGFGAEVVATVAEKSRVPVAMRRVTRPDTFVPCHFGNQLEVLPSFRRVLAAAAELLDLDLAWREEPVEETGQFTIDAIGSGPADEAVLVTDVLVVPGDRVQVGDVVAIAEASKAAIDIASTVAGIVFEVLAAPGETATVGRPLIRLSISAGQRPKPITRERPVAPILTRRNANAADGSRAGGVSLPVVRPSVAELVRVPANGAAPKSHESGYTRRPLSQRQRALNRRLRQSAGAPTGAISQPLDWDRVVEVTRQLQLRHGHLPLAEFDVVAYAIARAAASHARFRSTLAGDDALLESARVHLGVAVHLPDDDLGLAVVREADQMSFGDFAAALAEQIAAAMNGEAADHADVRLVVTYLGGLPATDAVPVLVAPATGVLFIGAPQVMPEGRRARLCLTFDHRIVNGVAAARFLDEIGRQIERLADEPRDGASIVAPGDVARGWLLERVRAASVPQRRALVERAIADLTKPAANGRRAEGVSLPVGAIPSPAADLVRDPAESSVPNSYESGYGAAPIHEPLRNLGLSSLAAVELSVRLSESLACSLPQTLVWSYPTIAAIAAHLLDRLGMAEDTPPTTASPANDIDADLLAKVERLTPAQAAEVLAEFRAAAAFSKEAPC